MALKGKNYSHIHLIAHSAGANLIDFATSGLKYWALKEDRPVLDLHNTFLDAYDPSGDPSRYGKQADWSDNYVDTRSVFEIDVGFDQTKLFLKNGYNIDVTPLAVLDPCGALYSPIDLESIIYVAGCRHDRPYRFYGTSLHPAFVGNVASASADPIQINGTGGMGYPLSVENGHSLSTLGNLYPKDTKCIIGGEICYADSLPPSFWTFIPGAAADLLYDGVVGTVSTVVGVTTKVLFESIRLGFWLFPDSSPPLPAAKSAVLTDPASSIAILV